MNVLGISCYYHDSATCLMQDGRVVAAAQEERFDRQKHSPGFPIRAINACVQQAGLTTRDLDYVGFYEKPYLKFSRTILSHVRGYPFSYPGFIRSMPDWLAHRLTLPLDIAADLTHKGPVLFVKHHLAHASSAFFMSPFEEAAILTADGLGEWATTCYGTGSDRKIEIREELHYPDSLGLVYTAVTSYLGFPANGGEGRVMALSDFGEPSYLDLFRRIVPLCEDGSFRLDDRYFGFVRGRRMYSRRFIRAFGPPRKPGEEIEARHRDIAASLQAHLEEAILRMARHVHAVTGQANLCAAGGVFLNCVTNARILEETPFDRIYVQPAAGDSGGALGVAASISHSLLDLPRRGGMPHAFFGPSYSNRRIRRSLVHHGLTFRELGDAELAKSVADLISRGRVVGWFQGRMEFGPRALGARSILADPRDPAMKDRLNHEVKHREPFRPYGVSILRERTSEFFQFEGESPFMLLVASARPEVRDRIPSALHVDGSSRLQTLTAEENGLYREVVREFGEITGIPLVINTSFNDHGEPIVCSPDDACACYLRTKIDALAIGNFLAVKDEDAGGKERERVSE